MCHSKAKFTYHGTEYPLYYIVKAMHKHDYPYFYNSSNNPVQRITGGKPGGNSTSADYTYEQAVDTIGKLLYLTGLDMGIAYAPTGSGVASKAPYTLMNNLGYWTLSQYQSYNEDRIFSYVEDNYLIYLTGYNTKSGSGHAWVVDGARSCVNDQEEGHPRARFLHCDWGWNGYCNGYFNGAVFELPDRSYRCSDWFGVKRDTDVYKAPTL